jgi:hypothetical protein
MPITRSAIQCGALPYRRYKQETIRLASKSILTLCRAPMGPRAVNDPKDHSTRREISSPAISVWMHA